MRGSEGRPYTEIRRAFIHFDKDRTGVIGREAGAYTRSLQSST